MKSKAEPLEDIRLIRKMMEDSSRFLSLSGLSGISAGLCAIAGACAVYFGLLSDVVLRSKASAYATPEELVPLCWPIALVALGTLAIAVLSAWYFTWKKSRSAKGAFWTPSAKNMVFSLLSVLGVGGVLAAILTIKGYLLLVPGITLTFYGLALFHSSRYSHRDIAILSWLQILLGLAACLLPEYGFPLWIIGFGLLHIIYGTIMYLKYDRS